MKRHLVFLLATAAVLTSGSLFASLSPVMQEWRNGPAQYLMTPDEIAQWKTLPSDAEGQAFIDLFWARRDSNPATPENELKLTFDARVKFADLNYAFGKTKGSMTPRGKAVVLLGVPYSVRREGSAIGADIIKPSGAANSLAEAVDAMNDVSDSGHTGSDRVTRSETWTYEHDRLPSFAPQKTLTLYFVDQASDGDYRLGRSPDTNMSLVYQLATTAAITLPDLKTPPGSVHVSDPQYAVGTARPPLPATPATAPAPADGTLRTPALVDAVDRMRSATELPYKGVYVSYDEFVTPAGENFVPVQLYLTRLPTMPERPATFFGSVYDAGGVRVASYEQPVKLAASGVAFVADTSIKLAPGKYTGLFGLAVDGNPVALGRKEMEVHGVDKASAGVSKLILSDDIHPLLMAQAATDPFSFGGAKVVVKGDQIFTQKDELWFFVELRNPGTDSTGAPKIQMQIDVEGMSGKQPVRLTLPLRETQIEPLKGVAGHYALGQSIPLGRIPPGEYTMKLRLVDVVRNSTYDLDGKFTVTPGT
jgi:GWxTD domain-containing protein